MNIKKLMSSVVLSVCLMFSMFLPVHAADTVTLSFEKTDTPNKLQVVLTGMSDTKSFSLNLKVDGNVSFVNNLELSKELETKGARVDTRQSDPNILDVYVTSKNQIDENGKIVLGTIHMNGSVDEKYTISLNEKKDGIKGVSTTFNATSIPATGSNLVMNGNTQEIVDPSKPEEKPGEDGETPGETPEQKPEEKPGAGDSETGTPGENPEDESQGGGSVEDGESSVTGPQIDDSMKVSIKEVSDSKYLAMVKEVLAGISSKYKAFHVDITKDGKSITLTQSTVVRMEIPEGFDKSKLKVYDIQESNRSELAFTIDGNMVEFSITHLGNYVIAEQSANASTETGKDGSVSTGDTTRTTMYIALAAAALVGIAILGVLREKRKRSI